MNMERLPGGPGGGLGGPIGRVGMRFAGSGGLFAMGLYGERRRRPGRRIGSDSVTAGGESISVI